MQPKKMAIVGGLDPDHPDREKLHFESLETAEQALNELGAELATQGYHIVVYAADKRFIEADVVAGYVGSGLATPGSIHVHAPGGWKKRPQFPGEDDRKELFAFFDDSNYEWEVSYYRSLRDVDGILLVGGGHSTFITGVIATNYRIPLAAVATFGGSGRRIWRTLVPGQDLVEPMEKAHLSRPWDDDSAAHIVECVTNQIERRQQEQEQERQKQRRIAANMRRYAWLSMVLFVVSFLAVPVTWAYPNLPYAAAVWILFLSPLLAGVSGATVRAIFDHRQGRTEHSWQSILSTCALGLVAGGISGLLFVGAQLVATPSERVLLIQPGAKAAVDSVKLTPAEGIRTVHVRNLIPFALAIGFTAGLTLDLVFRKLLRRDVLRTTGLQAPPPGAQ